MIPNSGSVRKGFIFNNHFFRLPPWIVKNIMKNLEERKAKSNIDSDSGNIDKSLKTVKKEVSLMKRDIKSIKKDLQVLIEYVKFSKK